MTADALLALRGHGVEIGSHTQAHPDLTTLDRHAAVAALRRGKRELEELLGEPVDPLAYPFGRADGGTREAARAAGFVAACRTSGQGDWSDPLDIPRQDMTNASTMLGLRLKRDDRYESLIKRLPFRAARSARRRLLRATGR